VLRARFPQHQSKLHALGVWSRQPDVAKPNAGSDDEARLQALLDEDTPNGLHDEAADDIIDPYGGSLEAYRSCARRIEKAVAGLRTALRRNEVQGL
jgi:protein-tyrosine-phosphatase